MAAPLPPPPARPPRPTRRPARSPRSAGTEGTAGTARSAAERGTRAGLRLIARAGGLPVMSNPRVRAVVERLVYRSTRRGFHAETVARRAFTARAGGASPSRPAAVPATGLFDLTPTDDQSAITGVARDLADGVLRPAAARADTDRALPERVRDAARQVGLTLLGVPEDVGGIAEHASAVTSVLVLEELARGDMGLAVALMAPAAVANALALYGSAEQQATYLPAFTGPDPVRTAALAILEPQPLFDPFAPHTTARRAGADLVLQGTKALVPGAADAELFVISAEVDGEPRLVLVEPGTPGVATEDDPAMGLRAAATGRLVLTEARVPATSLLGTTADHRDAVRRARLAWAAATVGTAQAALDQLVPYVTGRTAFGEPIAHRQAVAFAVADIAIELAGLRLVVWRAAARLDAGQDAGAQVAHARQLASRYAAEIGSQAVQLLGGHGFVKEYPNERWFRDLRGAGLMEGALLV